MTTPEKTYTEKQTAFLEALLGEARGDIRTAMTISGYAKTTKRRLHNGVFGAS